ncbi:MAG: PAS domain S-box protein [Deltaproteobacteria bacterium]|nr:PAS domain S-box protein [Deltaproteobacteria bacterium]
MRYVSSLGELEFDNDGTPVVLRGTIQDITERKLTEIALQESEERLQATLKAIPDVMFELGSDGQIYDYHASTLKQLAMPPEEFLGKRVVDSYPVEVANTIMAALQEATITGHSFGQQIWLAMPQGKRCFEISIARKAALPGVETRFIALSRDITGRKETEERMSELSRRLVLAQENARKRLSGELHDRTSPNLAAIGINLKMMASTFQYADSKGGGGSSILVNCIEDIKALIEDTTASIREICSDLRPPVLDYGGLVPALENYVAQFHRRTNLLVEIACQNSSIRLQSALESALFRIVQEALTNCAKHSHAKSVKIELSLENQHVILSVYDDGIGFDPGILEKVFPRRGLGILTMKEMVEFMDGEFDLVSIPGVGTRVTVRIFSPEEAA